MPDDDHTELNEIEILNSMRQLAVVAWSFYTALIEQGFTPDQALELTRDKLK